MDPTEEDPSSSTGEGQGSGGGNPFAAAVLTSAATAYILAAILLFILGLIGFCCCRIWFDLFGCRKRGLFLRRRNGGGGGGGGGKNRNNNNQFQQNVIVENDDDADVESKFKAMLEENNSDGDLVLEDEDKDNLPVTRIVVTSADQTEEEIAASKMRTIEQDTG